MSQERPDIVLEERYRTPLNYLKLALFSVFPAFVCLLTVAAFVQGFDKIAWQMYLFYASFLFFGVISAGEVICLGSAIICNMRGVLRIGAQQLVLQTAYYDKAIPLREITGIEQQVQKLGKSYVVGFCILQGRKGYYFHPFGLSSDEIMELIHMLHDLVVAAKRG